MTKPDQKAQEKQYMESFLDLLSYPSVDLLPKCPPKPDFAIQLASVAIGVEVTEYHETAATPSGHPRRVVEEEWQHIRKALKRSIKACPELNGVHGVLCFKDLNLPGRQDQATFVSEAIACAKDQDATCSVRLSDFDDYPLLAEFLSELRLRPIQCSMSWDWNHNTAWVGTDSHAFVRCIQRKTSKTYDTEGLDQTWLLIVSGPHLSQAMGLDLQHILPTIADADDALRRSMFSRAFVFQYMFDVAYEWPGWRKIGTENFRERRAQQDKSSVRGKPRR